MFIGITIEHLVAHVYTQYGLAKSFIKFLQLTSRPLIIRTKIPTSIWRHAILHAVVLICIIPSTYHKYSWLQLAFGQEPKFSYLSIFCFAV